MRYSPEHKERVRRRLLTQAAEQMRLHGPDGISLARIMSREGLTHGGFYAHFASKEALIAEAVRTMFEDAARRREHSLQHDNSLGAFIDHYLSEIHRDNPAHGCPLPALMSEVSRWPRVIREAFDGGVAKLAERLAALLPESVKDARDAAMSLIAEMAGAIAMSRAVSDRALSDALLGSSRDQLKRRFS